MTSPKEQKIVVITENSQHDAGIIKHGLALSSIFRKELCLLRNISKKQHAETAKEQLRRQAQVLNEELPNLRISTLLTRQSLHNFAPFLAEDHEAILIVANAQSFKNYSKAIAESPIPFLFVHPESSFTQYNHLVHPIDLRKENSDSALWCSYFGRFNRAEIISIAANDKDKDSQRIVAKNVLLTRKLFEKFNLNFKVFKGKRSSLRNVFEALDFALASDSNLLVILGSSTITPLDLLIGLPERKVVKRAGKLPILIINPRRDNYVLCD